MNLPIYGLCHKASSLGKMTLYRGVVPIFFDVSRYKSYQLADGALDLLVEKQCIEGDQDVVLTKGDDVEGGHTNSMKLLSWSQRQKEV